ncbi:MAG: hypothetical protein EXQ52_08195 [Bryobacterales bacterium]|nr:hypothetical protein [Bryobacterales bacterium]
MKFLSILALIATQSFAADFITGQAARSVIGQTTFTAQTPGASDTLLGGVGGLAYANDTLFVADSNRVGASPINNRVLIFRNVSGFLPKPTDELLYSQKCPVCVGSAAAVVGQPDFKNTDFKLTQTGLRLPTAVATDGRYLAVADTDNNRVLIWNTIPTTNGKPADVVIGQTDFTKNSISVPPNNKTMRGPQGVWFQGGRLFVADTQNHRVLIYNSVPSTNGKEADVVLGQPDFNTFVQPNIAQSTVEAKSTNLLNPVAVTSDGVRLFVTDLGHNRVLIWNTIPTANGAPANLVVGQPDLTSAVSNNASKVCPSNGKDLSGAATFPPQCEATLSFPRYALSDGRRLFLADGGNDRVLVYKTMPVRDGQAADSVIGQLGGGINQASDSTDSLRTPMSLAWDGTNLYVSDTYNRRVMVYSAGENTLPYTAVRNAASREIFAVGILTLSGTIKENDEITVRIVDKDYKYKAVKDDTFQKIVNGLIAAINKGPDPNVFASANPVTNGVVLTSRKPGSDGNQISYSTTLSDGATIAVSTGGATLSGGQDAAQIAPGTIVTIIGEKLSEAAVSADLSKEELPLDLGGVQVYFNGVRAPLFFVSPTQINAQVPFEFLDVTSINAFVRTVRKDGSVTVTTPVAVTIVPENPGIFADDGPDPRPGVVFHGTNFGSGTVSVDGSIKAGDVATVNIEDRSYTYTVVAGDTLESVRDKLIGLINTDEKVRAFAAGVFTRIRLRARQEGPEGNGITYSAKVNDGAQVILTPTGSALCCANSGRVTPANPAVPGETIIVYAAGLGLPEPADQVNTGKKYRGPDNQPKEFVSSLAGGKTANVLFAGLKQNDTGVYEVHLELNSDIPTDPFTQLTIAQFIYVSNIITFPVKNPNDEPAEP